MTDKILVFISLAALVAFLGVVIGFVAEPDLIIVTFLIVALAGHDFWISVFNPKNGTKRNSSTPLEALPAGVSGKPASGKKPAAKKTGRKKTPKRKK